MAKKNPYLYRIVRFERLVDLFETDTLFFARPHTWDDPYELKLEHPALNEVFGQCWCRQGVSDAMWRIYSADSLGVRIKVRREEFKDQLQYAKRIKGYESKKVADVKYWRQSDLDRYQRELAGQMDKEYKPRKALNTLFYKRHAFKHEAETRALIKVKEDDWSSNGIRVPVDAHLLVETILADPRMPKPVFEAFKNFLTDQYGFRGRFAQSGIYTSGQPLRVGEDDEV